MVIRQRRADRSHLLEPFGGLHRGSGASYSGPKNVIEARPQIDNSSVHVDAVGGTLALIEAASCPFVFVLTQAKPRTRLQMQEVLALAKHGKLAPTIIHDRTDFPTAAITGRTVTELEQEGPSAGEVRDVLTYVLTQSTKYGSRDEGRDAVRMVANG